ncbi:hypothetical protein KI688_002962 [Linnemannia hyalina]|uniref:Uncharacterized protein n=1 Tax=Linnemannia hyalina TaxID=64524 RepID=A0A9P8BQY8_9FUNG|nr:hypothetical protein KI688_002962 [Linnemannia hyalina]
MCALKLVSPFHHGCVRIEAQGPSSPPPQISSLFPLSSSTQGPTATRLKQLWFDPDIHVPEYHTLLLALLSHSPHLERLSFAAPSTPYQLSDLVSAFSKNLKLRHLELIEYNTSAFKNSNNNDYPADLIQASTYASSHLHSFTLRSFQTRATSSFIDRAVHALVHHQHSRTLERLDFCKDDEVASKDLQLLLMSCPNLTRFVVIDVEACESTTKNRSRIHIEDLAAGEWVCRGLKELCIGFTGFSTLAFSSSSSSSSGESATAQYHTALIYNHLACLTYLETLCLAGELLPFSVSPRDRWIPPPPSSSTYFDLSLKTGLARLEPLKYVQTLNLSQWQQFRIGKAEAAWMVEQWEGLRYVTLPAQEPPMVPEGYRAAGHFMDLVAVRPSLIVSIKA